MADSSINILLTTFAGLGLPRTLSIPSTRSTKIGDAVASIHDRLPAVDHPLVITTTANRYIDPSSHEALATLLPDEDAHFLPLRLSALVKGGKGGFGSQLRAAGGRMSSRKNRNQQNQAQNGSNRNLDGRRLRTVDAAKKLADYLTQKPEMEAREKEERRKKWESVVELATKREEDIKSGRTGDGRGRLDAEYVDSKELAEDKTREAVIQAMRNGVLGDGRTGSESSMDIEEDESDEGGEEESSGSSSERDKKQEAHGGNKTFFGWDEDDDDDDDYDDESEGDDESEAKNLQAPAPQPSPSYEGKGKAKMS